MLRPVGTTPGLRSGLFPGPGGINRPFKAASRLSISWCVLANLLELLRDGTNREQSLRQRVAGGPRGPERVFRRPSFNQQVPEKLFALLPQVFLPACRRAAPHRAARRHDLAEAIEETGPQARRQPGDESFSGGGSPSTCRLTLTFHCGPHRGRLPPRVASSFRPLEAGRFRDRDRYAGPGRGGRRSPAC